MEAGAHAVLLTVVEISLENDEVGKDANIGRKNPQNDDNNGDER